MKKKKNPKFYVNNEELYNLLVENKSFTDREKYVKENDKEQFYKDWNKVREKLGKTFLNIAKNILWKPNFVNYTHDWKNEMISNATYFMLKYLHKYDLTKKNPFGYYSTIAFRAYQQYLNKQNLQKERFIEIGYIDKMHEENNKMSEWEEDNF